MAIAFVNASSAVGAGASTSLAAPATSLTTGNTIVVGVGRHATAAEIIGVTDTAGNVYRPTGATQHTAASGLSVWYASNVTGNAANVVTATFNSATNRSITTVQISGLPSYPLDTWNVSASVTSATPTVAALTTLVANEIILVFGGNDASGGTWSASAGYTLATQDSSNFQGVAYQIVSSIQTAITPSITSTDSTNHKVAIAVTLNVALPAPTPRGPGTIVISDANANNGLDGVMISATTGATIDVRLPLGAFDGNGSGEDGAQLSNGTFLVSSKVTSTATIRSIQVFDATFTQLSITQPFTSLHWDVFSPMASDFASLFWVSKVDPTPNATQVRSLTAGGTLGTVLTLDDAAGPVVQSMGVSQDNSTLYYTTRVNGSAVKMWNTATNLTAGTLIASAGSTYWAQDLIVVPGSLSFVAIVQPAGSAGTTWELRQYSTVDGHAIAAVTLPGNLGAFAGPNLSLDVGAPSTSVWIRAYPDGTGATVQFLQVSLTTGTVITNFSVAQNQGGIGGGNQNAVPLTCPLFAWSSGGGFGPIATLFIGTRTNPPLKIRRERTVALPVQPGNARQTLSRLEIQLQPGTGTPGSPLADPKLFAQISWDYGKTWSNSRLMNAGREGAYLTRPFLNILGSGRYPVVRVFTTDTFVPVMTDGFIWVTPGAH